MCVLGSAEPGSAAYDMAGEAGELLARSGIHSGERLWKPGNASRRGAGARGGRGSSSASCLPTTSA